MNAGWFGRWSEGPVAVVGRSDVDEDWQRRLEQTHSWRSRDARAVTSRTNAQT